MAKSFHGPIVDLLPHRPPMQLVDALLDDGDEFARTEVTVRRDAMFANEDGWPGWVGAEVMAQTVAAWGGLQRLKNHKKVQLGFFLGTRRYECSLPTFPVGARLEVSVKMELVSEQGLAVFDCAIFMNGASEPVATAHLNVFQPNDITEYLKDVRP